jgi:hypothetical protein
MTKMSIGAAFSETFAFLKANWMQMLIWMGGALLVVGLLGYLLLGSTFSAMALAPNDPSLVMGAFGKIALFALIAAVILYGVSMLIWRGGMYPGEAPNFAWAFQAGPALAFGMFVVMIAAYIVIFIIMFVLTLIFGAALGGMGAFSPAALESGGAGAIGGGAIFLMIILYVAMIVFLLWVQGRFLVAGPVMANQLTRNPVTGLGESWRLTGPLAVDDRRLLSALHDRHIHLCNDRGPDLRRRSGRDSRRFGGGRDFDDDRHGRRRLPAGHHDFLLDAGRRLSRPLTARIGGCFRLICANGN